MSGKTNPDIEARVVILREAGYTLTTIAAELDLSLTTTKRIVKRRGASAGAATHALIDQARQRMLDNIFDLDSVQATAASLAQEDLCLARMLREKAMEVLESMDMSSSSPLQVMRTLTAAATALDLTQKTIRRALPLDRLSEATQTEQLSELRIRIMSDDDVKKMREQQRLEATERISGNPLLREQ